MKILTDEKELKRQFPPGKYYVIDPCYLISNENTAISWIEICNAFHWWDEDKVKLRKMAMHKAAKVYGKPLPDYVLDDIFSQHITMAERSWVVIEFDDSFAFLWGTKYGDGWYPVYKNGDAISFCGVDAGMLSIIPFDLAEKIKDRLPKKELFITIELDKPSELVYIERQGDVKLGNFTIITSGEIE